MEYKEELSRIPWKTDREYEALDAFIKETLNDPNALEPEERLLQRRAEQVVEGVLTNAAYQGNHLLKLSDAKTYIVSRSVRELKNDLDRQSVRADKEGNLDLAIRLADCYHSFLNAGSGMATAIKAVAETRLEEAVAREPQEEHSDELFTAYFDKDDPRVPPYTVNYGELEGFDRCVCAYMRNRIADYINSDGQIIRPEHMAAALLDLKTPSGKEAFSRFVEERMVQERGSADTGLVRDVTFDVCLGAKDKQKALFDAALRRGAVLMDKLPFYEEGLGRSGNFMDNMHEILQQLKEKPYAREGETFVSKKSDHTVELFHVRKARKYIYDKFQDNRNLGHDMRCCLQHSIRRFKESGMCGAKTYLRDIMSDLFLRKEIRDCALYISAKYLSMQKVKENTRTASLGFKKSIVSKDEELVL